MMIPHRLHVKYFVKEPATVDAAELVPIFHHWIQTQRLDGVLIDVADYRHVHEGPGVLLIGHEADFAFDGSRGRPGLLYIRKHATNGDLRDGLRTALHQALVGCRLLETEPSLAGRLSFQTEEAEIAFPDRLRLPNRPDALARVREDLEAVLTEVYGDTAAGLARIDRDARLPLTVRVTAPGAAPAAALLGRLQGLFAPASP